MDLTCTTYVREEQELTVCPYCYLISHQRAILRYVRSCLVAMNMHSLEYTCVLHGDFIVFLGEVVSVARPDYLFLNTHD
jgi:hypothetical protein